MIPLATSPEGKALRKRYERWLARQRKAQLSARLATFANPCHDPDTGRFCETEGGASSNPHLDKQIKELEDLIAEYEPMEGSDTVVGRLKETLARLQEKKASGAEPYHGVDLYNTPEDQVQPIKDAVDLITSLHPIDPSLDPVRVANDPRLRGGVLGNYMPAFNTIGMQSVKDTFLLTHELAHWQTLNPNFTLDKGREENIAQHFMDNVRKMGLSDVMKAATSSEAFGRIANRARSGDPYADYLATPHEVYARAYSQWVAIRSRNPRVRDQMERFRSVNHSHDLQWDDSSFEPIAEEFDRYFAGQSTRASAEDTVNADNLTSGLLSPGVQEQAPSLGTAQDILPVDNGHKLANANKYVEYLRDRAEFYNKCHSPETGEFCSGVRDAALAARREAPDHVRAAIDSYVGERYRQINGSLRGRRAATPESDQEIAALDEAFRNHSVPTAGAVVWRGLPVDSKTAQRMVPGAVIEDKGFVSTSTSQDDTTGFTTGGGTVIRIKTRKTTKAIAGNNAEQELILPRGTKLKITKRKQYRGYVEVHAEVVEG